MLKTRLEPIGGAGSRVSLGAGTTFAGTKDGFFQLGQLVRSAWGDLEARAGRAAGYGWGRGLGVSAARPGPVGLRFDLNRQTRCGWAPYALGNQAWRRAGGLQQISGALLSSGVTAQVFGLGFPFSCELEHSSTYRRNGLLAPEPPSPTVPWRTGRLWRAARHKQGGLRRHFTTQLFCGDAVRRDDGLVGALAPGASHALRRVYTHRYGVNFDRLLPVSPLRVRLQLVMRDLHNVELTRRGPDRIGARLERTARRERRLTLAAPLAPQSFVFSLFANLLPQLWFTRVHERRLESQVTFAGALQRNVSWRHLVGNPRAGGADAQAVQQVGNGRADDELAREYARLTQGIGDRTDALVEGIALEERRERRQKLLSPLHFLPVRTANVSPFFEQSEGRGTRSSLRDLHTAERLWGERSTALAYSHETFRDVTFECNRKARLLCNTEVRALWEGEACRTLQQLTLRTTWTFNGKNEAMAELDPEQVTDAVDCFNGLFDAELRPAGQQMVRCERKIRASYALQPQDVRALRERMRQKVINWPAVANLLAPESLHALRNALGGAATDEAAFEAIGDFLTQARRSRVANDASLGTASAPDSVLAMAVLRVLLPAAPAVTTELESNHRPVQLERAREVVVRYAGRPLPAEDQALALHDRAARVLAATGELDDLYATLINDPSLQGEGRRRLFKTIAAHRRQLCQLLQLPVERGLAAQRRLGARLLSSPWGEAERRKLTQLLSLAQGPPTTKLHQG